MLRTPNQSLLTLFEPPKVIPTFSRCINLGNPRNLNPKVVELPAYEVFGLKAIRRMPHQPSADLLDDARDAQLSRFVSGVRLFESDLPDLFDLMQNNGLWPLAESYDDFAKSAQRILLHTKPSVFIPEDSVFWRNLMRSRVANADVLSTTNWAFWSVYTNADHYANAVTKVIKLPQTITRTAITKTPYKMLTYNYFSSLPISSWYTSEQLYQLFLQHDGSFCNFPEAFYLRWTQEHRAFLSRFQSAEGAAKALLAAVSAGELFVYDDNKQPITRFAVGTLARTLSKQRRNRFQV